MDLSLSLIRCLSPSSVCSVTTTMNASSLSLVVVHRKQQQTFFFFFFFVFFSPNNNNNNNPVVRVIMIDDDDDDDFEANFDQKREERHVFWVPSFYETLKSNPFKKKKKKYSCHIETDDNRVNLSLTFPLFQKHTDLMSDRLVQFGPDLESNEVVQIRVNRKTRFLGAFFL